LYKRLGVSKAATPDEIKKAYRKLALSKHPDRGGDTKEFQAIQQAHEVLMDSQKRAAYDATGSIPGEGAADGSHEVNVPDINEILRMFTGAGGPGGMPGMPGGFPFPFFGGGGPGSGSGPGGIKAARGPNKIHEIGVSLADLYAGKKFDFHMKRQVLCTGCNGKGGAETEMCKSCGGRGLRMEGRQMGPMLAMTQVPCDACAQTGLKVVVECETCKGSRLVERESTLTASIEPGMQEGDRLVFPGQCSESPMYEAPGDVILVIRAATTDSEKWLRRGPELAMEVQLTLAEAMLGWERHIEDHPSTKPLHIVWTGGVIRDSEVLRIPGWGMPVRGSSSASHGDLRIICRVAAIHDIWSSEQLEALKKVWPAWVAPAAAEGAATPVRC
jgi:DnaJ family protein A protein 2